MDGREDFLRRKVGRGMPFGEWYYEYSREIWLKGCVYDIYIQSRSKKSIIPCRNISMGFKTHIRFVENMNSFNVNCSNYRQVNIN